MLQQQTCVSVGTACGADEVHAPADLLIGKKFDSRVWHNSDTVGAVALKHPFDALPLVHVLAALQSDRHWVSL